MAYFTTDNTEGYSADDLATLNDAWRSIGASQLDPWEPAGKSIMDFAAERLLAAYDNGKRGDDLVAFWYDESTGE